MSLVNRRIANRQGQALEASTEIHHRAPSRANILVLVDEFHSSYGGTEQHILFLLDRLPRCGFRMHFGVLSRICHADPASFHVKPVLLRNGCRTGRIGSMQRLRRLVAFIRLNQIDVVHTFSFVSELSALLATGIAGKGRVLAARRNTGYSHTWRTLWRARLTRVLGAHYVANCDAVRVFTVDKEWAPLDRVTVIRNPVCLGRLQEGFADVSVADSLGIHDGGQVVGIVATIRPIKDHATFLHAARFVLNEHPRTNFVIVGWQEPDTYARLQSLVRNLGIERQVLWTGPVSNAFSLLPHLDVGVLSSRSEGLSNALLEYAAAGVATVATDVGGTSEIVQDGETGFLVPAGSPELMAERIGRLLNNPELRRRFGANARMRAMRNFSEDRVLREYTELYEKLARRSECYNA